MTGSRILPFWETKQLKEMTHDEWESLCDGCGKCCLVLFEDDDTDEVWETDLTCKLFDCKTRRCRDYANRRALVPGCVHLTPDNIQSLKWMPDTCAYRRLAEGKGLADWHPLITGSHASVAEAGIAVSADLLSESVVPEEQQEFHIHARRWPEG
ncbi:MAG: YcgN family cysteine cluster protein [Aquisalinus sp.]|nr:YcgN family cysteine cluster protein [Aquisalinus sp.]